MSSRRRRTVEEDASDDEVWSDDEDNGDDEEQEDDEGDDGDDVEVDDEEDDENADDEEDEEVDDDGDKKEDGNNDDFNKKENELLKIDASNDVRFNEMTTEEYSSIAIIGYDNISNDKDSESDIQIVEDKYDHAGSLMPKYSNRLTNERQVKNQERNIGSENLDNKDESRGGRKKDDKRNPAAVPKGGQFFLHDDRGGDDNKNRRPEIRNVTRKSASKDDDNMWKHDKFVELYQDRSPSPPRQQRQQHQPRQQPQSSGGRVNKFNGKSKNNSNNNFNSDNLFSRDNTVRNIAAGKIDGNIKNAANNKKQQGTSPSAVPGTFSAMPTNKISNVATPLYSNSSHQNTNNNTNTIRTMDRGRVTDTAGSNTTNTALSPYHTSTTAPVTASNHSINQYNNTINYKSNTSRPPAFSGSGSGLGSVQPPPGLTKNYSSGTSPYNTEPYNIETSRIDYQQNSSSNKSNVPPNNLDLKLKASAPEFKPAQLESDSPVAATTSSASFATSDQSQRYRSYNGITQSSATSNVNNSSSYNNHSAITSSNSIPLHHHQDYSLSQSLSAMSAPYPPQQYSNYSISHSIDTASNLSPYSDHAQSLPASMSMNMNMNMNSNNRVGSGMSLTESANYSMRNMSLQQQPQPQTHMQQQPMMTSFPTVPPGFAYTPATNISNTMMYGNGGGVAMSVPVSPSPSSAAPPPMTMSTVGNTAIGNWFPANQQNIYMNSNGIPMYYNNQLQQPMNDSNNNNSSNSNSGSAGVSSSLSNLDVNARTFRPYGYHWG